ncbi:ParB/RepB/Spo0J family partition protein [Robbsia andropogonis]|uniref:ParB/RepB/Spo0J family partition protein n=1 Tax=Robbsia andropogonis TaxID=28092 RepID=UPI00046307BE|nr:ParB/RepB/Spo0J family partition protein [Robbsia andropogonis]MCP1118546.1 ParB/RepB/Spo0J family partition protein [Robbsia andropogonis]MCP1128013.1 ParB/RepB/Spo0J family partition protein [Robbsia andropogonis]
MSKQREEAARLAAAALGTDVLPTFSRRAPRVAMNTVSDFTGELERAERDLSEAKVRLAEYDGALPTRKIDAKQVRLSRFANRIEDSFRDADFAALKAEIANAGGNIQPIKVRRAGESYELVWGHRRHRACLELDLPVLATITESMSDRELFEEMSRENEQRKNLSAYEMAMHYRRAVDLKLYKNWSEVAAVLGKTRGLLSRYSALADLPKVIVEAFPSPNDIQPKWAATLRKVFDVDAEAVSQAAQRVKGRSLPARSVFETLVNLPVKQFTRVNIGACQWTESEDAVRIDIDRRRFDNNKLQAVRSFLQELEKSD